jgi:type I restriction enzyme M protein
MEWIAPSEKNQDTETLEDRLWKAADQLHANSGLKSKRGSRIDEPAAYHAAGVLICPPSRASNGCSELP